MFSRRYQYFNMALIISILNLPNADITAKFALLRCTPRINLLNLMCNFSASVLLKILCKEIPFRNLELTGLKTHQISLLYENIRLIV